MSVPLGPAYDCPDCNTGTVNAAHADQIICYAPNVRLLTAVVTCRPQVRHDPAGILLERVERLSKHQHEANRY